MINLTQNLRTLGVIFTNYLHSDMWNFSLKDLGQILYQEGHIMLEWATQKVY
jgi:hypothetical protein